MAKPPVRTLLWSVGAAVVTVLALDRAKGVAPASVSMPRKRA